MIVEFEITPDDARDLLKRCWTTFDAWAPQLTAAIEDALAEEDEPAAAPSPRAAL